MSIQDLPGLAAPTLAATLNALKLASRFRRPAKLSTSLNRGIELATREMLDEQLLSIDVVARRPVQISLVCFQALEAKRKRRTREGLILIPPVLHGPTLPHTIMVGRATWVLPKDAVGYYSDALTRMPTLRLLPMAVVCLGFKTVRLMAADLREVLGVSNT